jgi:mono/diheme cytochrome c family protein
VNVHKQGIPTDDDLLHTLRYGIPGSSMPSFAQLSEAELNSLIGYIRRLTWNGLYEALRKKAAEEDDVDPFEISKKTDNQLTPGKTLEIPAKFASATTESVSRGRKVYEQNCLNCHGPTGKGDGQQVKDLKNDNGTPARPRDLTAGIFKGGRDSDRIYRRLMLGIPGTPMGTFPSLKPDEIESLIHYVHSLSPVASQ